VTVSVDRIFDAVDGTWPAAEETQLGIWTLRRGDGGGKRVSAATTEAATALPDAIVRAETAMHEMGQTPLFMLRPGQEPLDVALGNRGYAVVDPVNIYACEVGKLTDKPIPRIMIFAIWEPLAIMNDIWDKGGIGPARRRVMERARGPKTGLLSRFNEQPAGTAFAAVHNGVAMVHAVEVLPHQRGLGVGSWMMRGAAFWARDNGADTLAVLCTKTNTGANALYSSLGFEMVGEYHYRIAKEEHT
jgi:GNAT superfamily N-acetyltransferase